MARKFAFFACGCGRIFRSGAKLAGFRIRQCPTCHQPVKDARGSSSMTEARKMSSRLVYPQKFDHVFRAGRMIVTPIGHKKETLS